MERLYSMISDIGRRHEVARIVLYGSRARGDARERSDIDIAIFGAGKQAQADIIEEIEQLPTLLEFDIVFVGDKTDAGLLSNIEKDGIVIYE